MILNNVGVKWCHPNENAVSDWPFAKSCMQHLRIQRVNCIVTEKYSSIVIEKYSPMQFRLFVVQVLNIIWNGLKKENLEDAGGRYKKQVSHM